MNPFIFYDITEFLSNPLCTGIQRVAFEIARSWPNSVSLKYCFTRSSDHLILLPDSFFSLMTSFFDDQSDNKSHIANQIKQLSHYSGPVVTQKDLFSSLGILVPEVFFDQNRINFYQNLFEQNYQNIFFVCFDMLPWLHPEWFSIGAVLGTMPYLKLLMRSFHRCFISSQSAIDFRDRILRKPSQKLDQVIPLGADAFGLIPPQFHSRTREFAVLGSIEPRKNHSAILDSFLNLWKSGIDCSVTFLGRVGWIDSDFLDQLNQLARTESRFQWFKNPSDQFIISRIRSVRATIYPSLGEGYGLPPVESLALGVPVIVSAHLPSVQMLSPLGQLLLDIPNSVNIQAAVLQMLDDQFAQAKYREVEQIQPQLPRWANLGPLLVDWIFSIRSSAVDYG